MSDTGDSTQANYNQYQFNVVLHEAKEKGWKDNSRAGFWQTLQGGVREAGGGAPLWDRNEWVGMPIADWRTNAGMFKSARGGSGLGPLSTAIGRGIRNGVRAKRASRKETVANARTAAGEMAKKQAATNGNRPARTTENTYGSDEGSGGGGWMNDAVGGDSEAPTNLYDNSGMTIEEKRAKYTNRNKQQPTPSLTPQEGFDLQLGFENMVHPSDRGYQRVRLIGQGSRPVGPNPTSGVL